MKKILTVMALCACALVGCMSVGNESIRSENKTSVKHKITNGKTSKSDVISLFGQPDSVSFTDAGNEIWQYSFVKTSWNLVNYIPILNWLGSSSSGTNKQLTILFNGNVVKTHSLVESGHSIKTGIYNN